MTDEELRALAKAAHDRYHAMPASQRLRHDYEQHRSFARGMCSDTTDYDTYCKAIDKRMPPPDGLSDAQIGLILLSSPWHP